MSRRKGRRAGRRLLATIASLGGIAVLWGGIYVVVAQPELPRLELRSLIPAGEEAVGAPVAGGGEAVEADAVPASRGVFRLESEAGVLGSAFAGWVAGGRTRLLTAYPAVRSVVADGFGELTVRRGDRRWRARQVGSDKLTGLVVLRLEGRAARPLWTRPVGPGLADGDTVRVVTTRGRAVSGQVSVADGEISLDVPFDPLHLGAPVVTEDGRLAGVVRGTGHEGELLVTPIEHACGRIRSC